MKPERDYRIRVRGENEAGNSDWSAPEPYTTSSARSPATPVFGVDTLIKDESASTPIYMCNDMCQVEWTEPENHGRPVTGYAIYYADWKMEADGSMGKVAGAFIPVTSTDGSTLPAHEHAAQLRMLSPDHYYAIRLVAVNELGDSQPAELILRTPGTWLELKV